MQRRVTRMEDKKRILELFNSLWSRIDLDKANTLVANLTFYRYLSENKSLLKLKIAKQDRFATVVDDAKEDKLTIKKLKTKLHAVENTNAKLKDIFQSLDLDSAEYGNSENERISLFKEVILLVNNLQFDEADYGEFFELLFKQHSFKAALVSTSKSISQVVAKILATNIKNQKLTIYDPAIGTASMTVTLLNNLDTTNITIIGNEINPVAYNVARMNLIVHGLKLDQFTIKNINSLDEKWDGQEDADIIAVDPPYSSKWKADPALLEDSRFKKYGVLPPQSRSDFAFLLQGLAHLKENGTMAIVVPHGVLFRSAKEGKIRQQLLEDGNIEAVIGLPSNLAYNTGIPLTILILKKNKTNRNVFFIDASQEYEKGRRVNTLSDQEINKIVDVYKEKKEVKKYSHLATWKEIQKNNFNLNIPRYIDRFDEAILPSLTEINSELENLHNQMKQDDSELIATLKQIHSEKDNAEVVKVIRLLKE